MAKKLVAVIDMAQTPTARTLRSLRSDPRSDLRKSRQSANLQDLEPNLIHPELSHLRRLKNFAGALRCSMRSAGSMESRAFSA